MAGIDDWLELMPQTLTVQRFISNDRFGKPVYGSPVTYQARIDYRTRMVRDSSGEERVARGQAWVATTDPITTKDFVRLDDGSTPPILNVDQVPDENGPLYTALQFQ